MTMYIKDTLKASISGNAATATKLATSRSITIGNKANNFDGSGSISFTLADIGAATSDHKHGLLHQSLGVEIANTTEDSGWTMFNSSYTGYMLKSVRFGASSPSWGVGNYGAGIIFGGSDTKGVISCAYGSPSIKIAGGNGSKPAWWMGLSGTSGTTYNLANFSTNGHTHSYLPLSGGTMTGELAFKEVTSTSYPAKSSSITWNGSTDGANIYYQVDASDKGRLVLNTRDDTDCLIGFAYNGTIHSTINTNGYFSGTSALADTSSRLDLYRTGQKDNANYVPGFSRLVVREFTNECSNMPSAHFYHIYTGQGGDANYNTQLAVGMTTEALCFRNRNAGGWTGWKKVSVEGHTHNYAPSSHSHTTPEAGAWFNEGFTKVRGDGVMEVGKYMDWHLSNGSTSDYDGRFTLSSANNLGWSGNLATAGIMESGSYAKIQGTPLSIQSSAPGCGGVWIQI